KDRGQPAAGEPQPKGFYEAMRQRGLLPAQSSIQQFGFPADASVEDKRELFLAKQDYLRRQIALQRSKLELLEKRLTQRERMATAMFGAIQEAASRDRDTEPETILTGDTQIDFDPETGTIAVLGKKESVERVLNVIDKIKQQAAADDERRSQTQQFEVIELKNLDTQMAMAAVVKFFQIGQKGDNEDVIVDGDILKRQLWVKGTAQQIDEIKTFLTQLESASAGRSGARSSGGGQGQEKAERARYFFDQLRSRQMREKGEVGGEVDGSDAKNADSEPSIEDRGGR
ncbi:MAG: hypothetical protein AAGG44_11895, partial [Planctomycetota bacterium]